MSTIARIDQILESLGDRLNPILVKETRQSLKSKSFAILFMLMLLISWLVSVFGVGLAGQELQDQPLGSRFFAVYVSILQAAVLIVVPLMAFRGLASERDLQTFEMLSITTLSPRRIILGKLTCALVQIFLYYSVITPFISFTYLLRGLDLVFVLLVLSYIFIASISLTIFGLTLCAVCKQKALNGFAMMGLLIQSVWVWGASMTLISYEFTQIRPDLDWRFLFFNLFWLSLILGALHLMLKVATAALTFEAGNRSTGIRASSSIFLLIPVLWLLGALVYFYFFDSADVYNMVYTESLELGAILVAVYSMGLAVLAFFATTEDLEFSKRVKRELSGSMILRILTFPWQPGAGRGLWYVLIHSLFLGGLGFFLTSQADSRILFSDTNFFSLYIQCTLCYIMIYSSIAIFINYGFRSASLEIRPIHVRIFLAVAFGLGLIAPNLIALYDQNFTINFPILFITDPITTVLKISNNGIYSAQLLLVVRALALIMTTSAVILARGAILEVFLAPTRTRRDLPPLPTSQWPEIEAGALQSMRPEEEEESE